MKKEARARQEDQRQRDLRDHQRPAQGLAPAIAGGLTTALFQRVHHVRLPGGQRRDQSRQNPRHDRKARREAENPQVQSDRLETRRGQRELRRQPGLEGENHPRGQQYAEGAAHQAEHGALGQELAGELASVCTQRGANGQFVATGQAARQLQVGHVCAYQHQHEQGRTSGQADQCEIAEDEFLAQGPHLNAPGSMTLRELQRQSTRDGAQFGLCLSGGGSGLDPAHQPQVRIVPT